MARLRSLVGIATLFVLAAALPARAQSAIVGVVKDGSGAIVPGVTVEASSPALIERVRTTVTDSTGQYRIVDLRPGTFALTFSLEGFATVKRDGIELPASFTAQVNAELKIGSLTDTVTVTGDAPIVDVRSSLQATTMDRELLDTIPNARNMFAQAAMTAGVQQSAFDVGGLQSHQEASVVVHGSDARDEAYQIDGMTFKSPFGSGNTAGHYFADGMFEAVTFRTSALPAEFELGGVGINMVLRDGGNQFRGNMFVGVAPARMQSDNLSADLKARGLATANKLIRMYDVNPSFGGPVLKDKVWFFVMYRRFRLNQFVAGQFNVDGTRAVDDNVIKDKMFRVTAQLNRSNKFFVFYESDDKFRGHRRDTTSDYQFIDAKASIYQTSPTNFVFGTKLTSTLSNKILLENGYSLNDTVSDRDRQPNVISTDIPTVDFTRSTLTNSYVFALRNRSFQGSYTGALSYVTGAHAFKTGTSIGKGSYRVAQNVNGGMVLRLSNGVANTVDLYNSPTNAVQNVNWDVGVYAQDSWTIRRRLTLNLGVRYSKYVSGLPVQTAPAGLWVGERSFPEVKNVPNMSDFVPRIGVTFDPTGEGRTVLKGSASKYLTNQGTDLAQSVNPMILSTNRCRWADANGNFLAENSEITACAGFTGGVSTAIDPDLQRPGNWEYTAGVDHELKSGLGFGVTYYRREFVDQIGTRNLAVTPADYTPVTITNPITNQPLVIYNQSLATRGLQNNYQTNDPTLTSIYNGIEMRGTARLKFGAFLGGGLTIGRKEGPTTTTNLNNPNTLINYIGALAGDSTVQVKLSGSLPLPGDISISGAYQSSTGTPLARTFTVTTALVPNLTQTTQAVAVVPAGEFRLGHKDLVDIRFSKNIRFGSRKINLQADLFNVLNENAPTAEVTAVGSSLGRPSSIVDARTFRVGFDLVF